MDVDVDVDRAELLSLPNETLITILHYLSPPSLVALIRSCKRLQGVCERLLYSDIDIEESVDGDPQAIVTPFKTDGCCTAVRRRPYLATAIKRISIRWTRDRARSRHQVLLAPGIASSLRCLLHMASYIDTLELHLAGFRGSYREILEGCAFRLRVLALSGPENVEVEWFLQLQSGVAHLHLADQHRPLRLRNFDLPFLESFRGDARAAATIVPGRPIRALALSGHEPTEQSLIACGHSKHPIRRLDLGNLSITPTQLLIISKHLTAPETLRIRLALRHTLHFTFSGMVCSSTHQLFFSFRIMDSTISASCINFFVTTPS